MNKITILLLFVITNCFGQTLDLNQIRNEYLKGNFKEVVKNCSIELKKIEVKDTLFKDLVQFRVGSYMRLSDFNAAIEDYKLLIKIG